MRPNIVMLRYFNIQGKVTICSLHRLEIACKQRLFCGYPGFGDIDSRQRNTGSHGFYCREELFFPMYGRRKSIINHNKTTQDLVHCVE